MDDRERWLSEPRTALSNAVTMCVREHVAGLRARGVDPYGYALLPGEPYDIHSLVAAYNCETDIKVSPDDEQYFYYRHSVDEWRHWEHNGFDTVNRLLVAANARFSSLHPKEEGAFGMDDFATAHSDSLLLAILEGLEAASSEGAFGDSQPFLAMWISDSQHGIMPESVNRLNAPRIAEAFMKAFW